MILLKPYEAELKKYCEENSISFEKVIASPRCGSDKVLFIQRIDKKKGLNNTKNNVPAEILITATIDEKGKIAFTKGENADKYLHA